MITVTIEKTYGASTVRAKISAPTIERAVELTGGPKNSRVDFPIDGEAFFATRRGYPVERGGIHYDEMTYEEICAAFEAGLPGSYAPYIEAQKDMLGHGFEQYALENYLV